MNNDVVSNTGTVCRIAGDEWRLSIFNRYHCITAKRIIIHKKAKVILKVGY